MSDKPPLTRRELDKMGCGMPGCTEKHGSVYLHAPCHVQSPTWVRYEDGVLIVCCGECDRPVTRIAVAP